MLEKILRFFEKYIIPKFLYRLGQPIYHFLLTFLSALIYRFPSNKLIVIGVTGTSGKTTIVNLIAKVLEEAGYKVGLTSSINFRIGEKEWENETRMTMLGRFSLQKLLKEMLKEKCDYAIIETSSEGILQSRHLGINYDIAIFTNLTPEHIERHKGFENYKRTKGKFFELLKNLKTKKLKNKEINPVRDKPLNGVKKISIINLDDENADYFLSFEADEKYGFAICDTNLRMHTNDTNKIKKVVAENIKINSGGSEFMVSGLEFRLNLPAEFNVYNALACIALGLSQEIDLEIIKRALEKIEFIPGRMQELKFGQDFKIFIDYAHTTDELEKVYQFLSSKLKVQGSRLICLLGSCGGGRDKWKRPKMGEVASKYCDYIILTNEDPYDENPSQILSEIKSGISIRQPADSNLFEILDRKEAIEKALSLAQKGDIVIFTGKGTETTIIEKDKKISWNEEKIIRSTLQALK